MDVKSHEWDKQPDRMVILNSTNYARWKYDTDVILQARGLVKIVTGEEKPPTKIKSDADSASKERYLADVNGWITKDARAREILTRSLDERHHDMIRSQSTAHGIFKTIRNIYEQKSASNVFQAQREFHESHWGRDGNALGFITKLKCIQAKLRSMGEEISDASIISKTMNELPSYYDIFKETWEVNTLTSSGGSLSLDDFTSQLMRQEALQQSKKKDPSHAYFGKKEFKKRQVTDDRKCNVCGKKGHLKKDCWYRDKNPKSSFQERDNNPKIRKGFVSSKDGNKKSQKEEERHGKQEGVGKATGFITSVVYPDTSMQDVWIADSGASNHMTNRREWFDTYKEMKEEILIVTGSGESIKVRGIGNINILFLDDGKWIESYFNDVYYIPELGNVNLFSLGKAERGDVKSKSRTE